MSLIQQDSSNAERANQGGELPPGSSNALLSSVIAAVLVCLAIFLYVRLGEKPPASSGEVTSVVAHVIHRETSGLDANGAPMPKEIFDQVLLFSHARIHNQSKQPLFLHQIMSNVTLSDGIHTSYAAVPSEYERIFQGFPELASLHGKPLPSETTLEAGQTLEGDFICAFRLSKADWDSRKAVDFTFAFRYQPLLKVVPSGPVTDR